MEATREGKRKKKFEKNLWGIRSPFKLLLRLASALASMATSSFMGKVGTELWQKNVVNLPLVIAICTRLSLDDNSVHWEKKPKKKGNRGSQFEAHR